MRHILFFVILPMPGRKLFRRLSMEIICSDCPRRCRARRGDTLPGGICRSPLLPRVVRAVPHYGEEPCISGTRGAGTIFFSGCSLRCIYCQNLEISRMRIGKEVSIERLSKIFLELQQKGAHNINLVTPTHYALQIREAILSARAQGLSIPTVWNSSGYEKAETLRALSDVIDIYLTDVKYLDSELSKNFSSAPDYPEVIQKAFPEMLRQYPACIYDENGLMRSGVIVRHLVLPGHVRNTEAVLKYLSAFPKDSFLLSLMSQYTPLRTIEKYPELNRRLTKREYERAVDYALSLGFTDALIQEGKAAEESFIPAFDYEGVQDNRYDFS